MISNEDYNNDNRSQNKRQAPFRNFSEDCLILVSKG